MSALPEPAAEWLEADGLGGFASGGADLVRRRRYHALLLAATAPPSGRVVLLNGLEVWVDGPFGRAFLSTHRYAPDVRHPDGAERIVAFAAEPWPTWTFGLPDGSTVVHELFVPRGCARIVLGWRAEGSRPDLTLCVRPLLSGRDYHALHHENAAFAFDAQVAGDAVQWRPYAALPAVRARANGHYVHEPCWYRRFLYTEETARGLDDVEDLASPGVFRFALRDEPAWLTCATPGQPSDALDGDGELPPAAAALRSAERARRAAFPSRLHRAADAYVVRRGEGRTIIAGYPWFTDWGRDTFIALRGLCLSTGRLDEARAILLAWAEHVSAGMLPNRFPDDAHAAPEYNAVDASLWYVVAVHDYLRLASRQRARDAETRARLRDAVLAIVAGHAAGTRHGIRMDESGLLAAGEPGVQLTWMDAVVGEHVVTPRIGKPVEVEALWLNALRIAGAFDARWREVHDRAAAAFAARFWNAARACLFDVVDEGHVPGRADPALRPNQILAVGGLPFPPLAGARARAVVDAVEQHLLTPLGLRSLAPGEPGYAPRYEGGVAQRDGAYHQGTVWPWLLGPFVEAWVRVRGRTDAARAEARRRFVAPLLAQLDVAGLGHVSEIADAEPPHTPRGCPFQAWSVGELLRLTETVLGCPARPAARGTAAQPRTPKTRIPNGRRGVAR